jgi:F-type H+-transporting ATPase subunit a
MGVGGQHLAPAALPPGITRYPLYDLIRPGTLAVRVTANIIAGHLLLTLLGNNGPSIRQTILTVLITAHILLLILEAAVAVIQSYVFAILRTLYSREVN